MNVTEFLIEHKWVLFTDEQLTEIKEALDDFEFVSSQVVVDKMLTEIRTEILKRRSPNA